MKAKILCRLSQTQRISRSPCVYVPLLQDHGSVVPVINKPIDWTSISMKFYHLVLQLMIIKKEIKAMTLMFMTMFNFQKVKKIHAFHVVTLRTFRRMWSKFT